MKEEQDMSITLISDGPASSPTVVDDDVEHLPYSAKLVRTRGFASGSESPSKHHLKPVDWGQLTDESDESDDERLEKAMGFLAFFSQSSSSDISLPQASSVFELDQTFDFTVGETTSPGNMSILPMQMISA